MGHVGTFLGSARGRRKEHGAGITGQASRGPAITRLVGLFTAVLLLGGLTWLVRPSAQSAVSFEDASGRLGGFHHFSFTVGGEGLAGAAWLDYNNDGHLDLFVTNGKGHANALFRNNGDGTFTNVASLAGVDDTLGHAGVVVADIDNDGFPDLFLTGEGHSTGAQSRTVLYHNNGDGTFTDITATAGVLAAEPAFSAAFADIDNDGFVDLFVTGSGNLFTAVPNRNKLYRNNGDLTFTDISHSAGIDTNLGACAAGFTDFNRDGRIDLFIANCNGFSGPLAPVVTPFELYRNNGDLTFTNVAPEVGLTDLGFWMAAAFGDYNNDGRIDMFATNVGAFPGNLAGFNFPHALLRHKGGFTNVSAQAGVAAWEFGWGATFADFDNDGHLDLFFAGSLPGVFNIIGPTLASPGRLFINNGAGGFVESSAGNIPVDLSSSYATGVAAGDFDGDGFPDIVVMRDTLDDTQPVGPVLFRNRGNDNNWLTVRTVGTVSNREGIGARVSVIAGDLHQVREIRAGSSFASSETPWPTFGMGKFDRALVRVRWPSGREELFTNVRARQIVTLVEGTGISVRRGR